MHSPPDYRFASIPAARVGLATNSFLATFSAGGQQISSLFTINCPYDPPACSAPPANTQEIILTTSVGQTLIVSGYSEIHGAETTGPENLDYQINSHAIFTINDLTAGTNYTTASGTSYGTGWAAVIPEPPALLLLSSGFVVLPFLRKLANNPSCNET